MNHTEKIHHKSGLATTTMRFSHCRRSGRIRLLFNTRSMTKLVGILVVSLLIYNFFFYLCIYSRNVFQSSLRARPVVVKGRNSKNCSNIRPFDTYVSRGSTKFPLIMPHVQPNISCEDRNLFIAVVVNSAIDDQHLLRRIAIRKTWGISTKEQTKRRWRLFFALGMGRNAVVNFQNQREALKFNDIIIGNFTDTYKNVVIKTFMSHFWAYFRLNCKYVLKCDDDVYIRVPRLAEWLVGPADLPTRFYGGHISRSLSVVRNPRYKWFLPRQVYNETRFPPFSHGSFQVVSADMLSSFFHYTQFIRKPFYTDDAYFGVMARDLGLTARQIPGFVFFHPRTDNFLRASIAFGHQVDVVKMLRYYARYELLA